VHLYFVDHGVYTWTHFSNIYGTPTPLNFYPQQTIVCALANVGRNILLTIVNLNKLTHALR
jgi:hypothetical protein